MNLDLKSTECLSKIDVVINQIMTERKHKHWNTGQRPKRDSIDSLIERGMVNSTRIADEFILIQKKESKLPLRERELITGIIGMAVMKTIKK